MKNLIIIGAGGVGRFVAEQVRTLSAWNSRWHLLGFLDDAPAAQGRIVDGLPVLGPVDSITAQGACDVVIGVAAPAAKQALVRRLTPLPGLGFPALTHPRAWVAESVTIGRGTLIYPGACINFQASIGDFVTVNLNATIGHEVRVGHWATIAPRAGIGGNCSLGEGVEFGIGASMIQGCAVGEWSRVGAGAVLLRDAPARVIMFGVPARPVLPKDAPATTPA